MTDSDSTAAEIYFERRLEDPQYRKAFNATRRKLSGIKDVGVNANGQWVEVTTYRDKDGNIVQVEVQINNPRQHGT